MRQRGARLVQHPNGTEMLRQRQKVQRSAPICSDISGGWSESRFTPSAIELSYPRCGKNTPAVAGKEKTPPLPHPATTPIRWPPYSRHHSCTGPTPRYFSGRHNRRHPENPKVKASAAQSQPLQSQGSHSTMTCACRCTSRLLRFAALSGFPVRPLRNIPTARPHQQAPLPTAAQPEK